MLRMSGMWKTKTKKDETMLSGTVGGMKFIVLPNTFKKNPKEPDYILYVAESGKEETRANPESGDIL